MNGTFLLTSFDSHFGSTAEVKPVSTLIIHTVTHTHTITPASPASPPLNVSGPFSERWASHQVRDQKLFILPVSKVTFLQCGDMLRCSAVVFDPFTFKTIKFHLYTQKSHQRGYWPPCPIISLGPDSSARPSTRTSWKKQNEKVFTL